VLTLASSACKTGSKKTEAQILPEAVLVPSEKFLFNSFVDCNMATVWVKDTFRIFLVNMEKILYGQGKRI
jgi:hypothetical protein